MAPLRMTPPWLTPLQPTPLWMTLLWMTLLWMTPLWMTLLWMTLPSTVCLSSCKFLALAIERVPGDIGCHHFWHGFRDVDTGRHLRAHRRRRHGPCVRR